MIHYKKSDLEHRGGFLWDIMDGLKNKKISRKRKA